MSISILRPLLLASAFCSLALAPASAQTQRPNVLLVIADDLARSDLGSFGGEIATPTLDALAAEGLRFTNFHVSPSCSPSRAMLLTGTDNHRVGLSTMVEVAADNQRGQPGYEGFLSTRTVTMGEIFVSAGYQSIWSGKWHLGFQPHADPHTRGFAASLAMLHGAHDHFGGGYTPDPKAGNSISRNGQVLTTLPKDFYSSAAFTSHMIDELAKTPPEKPVLAVLSFTAPHWPLQAPARDIAAQQGRYDAGWQALADARLARQKSLGLVPDHAAVPKPARGKSDWQGLSPEEKARQARLMEVYAAMVARMDTELGRVIAELKRSGRYDNTIIVFMSDNGPESLDFQTTNLTVLTDRWKAADRKLEAIGGPASFEAYGAGWAEASASPSRLFKAWSTEGGTRSPLIVKLPKATTSTQSGKIVQGFAHVSDILPTLMDLAAIPDHGAQFAGRDVERIRGYSLRPVVEGRAQTARPAGTMVAGELFGQRSVFDGNWKALDTGDGIWKLFDVAADPSELDDLSTGQAERLRRMSAHWDTWAREVRLIMPINPPYRP